MSAVTPPASSDEHLDQDIPRLTDLAEEILSQAKKQGASAAEAGISASAGLSVTVRMGEVETVEHNRDKGLGVTVYFGLNKGSASTTDFSHPAILETVEAACRIARYTAADDCAGLADAELMAGEIPSLDLYHPWALEPQQAIDIGLQCENAARELDPRITNSEGVSVSRQEGSHVYGNSHGFIGAHSGTRNSVSCAVIAQNESGMQRDHWYDIARDPAELLAPEKIGKIAAERALGRLDATQLPTGGVSVVFAAEVASSLFSHLVGAIQGGNLYRKSSFLLDHLGKQVFPEHIRIHEQPHLPKALGSTPFDNEGVATAARDIVSAGILRGYVLNSYSARKLGMQTTGNAGGVHNLSVAPGTRDLAGLLECMDKGLLVTEFLGMGVNLVTGDYSRGAAGFWIENGQVAYPVEEITIAGNLRDMFLNIAEVGNDVDLRGNTRTGSVLIERMMVAGV